MERLARVEVLDDRLGQVRPHHPREPHLREGRELLGHARVRVLAFIFELQRRPDALDSYRGARPRRGGPRIRRVVDVVVVGVVVVAERVLSALRRFLARARGRRTRRRTEDVRTACVVLIAAQLWWRAYTVTVAGAGQSPAMVIEETLRRWTSCTRLLRTRLRCVGVRKEEGYKKTI